MSGQNKKTVFFVFFAIIAVFGSAYLVTWMSLRNDSQIELQEVDNSIENGEDSAYDVAMDPEDYEVGFQAGKYALFSQMHIEYVPDEKEVFAYSSFLEENDDPKYSNNKEYDRGYVDGYHRATEQIYCPASSGHK